MRSLKRLSEPSLYSVAVALFIVASCAVAPENYGERLAVAYATNTEVRQMATQALRTGRIDTDTARSILGLTDQARGLLDAAADGDERNLDLAIEILEQIERYLQ